MNNKNAICWYTSRTFSGAWSGWAKVTSPARPPCYILSQSFIQDMLSCLVKIKIITGDVATLQKGFEGSNNSPQPLPWLFTTPCSLTTGGELYFSILTPSTKKFFNRYMYEIFFKTEFICCRNNLNHRTEELKNPYVYVKLIFLHVHVLWYITFRS